MKIIVGSVMLALVGIGSLPAQTGKSELRGNYFGRTSLIGEDVFLPMTGTIQQTINDFRSGRRGVIRSSMMAASGDGLALAAWDVLRVRDRRLSMQTTFLSPCGCTSQGVVTLTGRATVRPRSVSYSAVSADGNYSLQGSIRLKRNRMVRRETRVIHDVDFDETDTFSFSSTLYLQGRRGR